MSGFKKIIHLSFSRANNSLNKKNTFKDPSIYSLLIANLFTVFIALIRNWNILVLLWVYWFQSVIIGFFYFLRIISLRNPVITLPGNHARLKIGRKTKFFLSLFFIFHYGLFHLFYFFFLLAGSLFVPLVKIGIAGSKSSSLGVLSFWVISKNNVKFILFSASLFFLNHAFSFLYARKVQEGNDEDIGKLMFYPYLRIIPMHLTIILAGFIMIGISPLSLIYPYTGSVLPKIIIAIFLLLKTFVDILSHTFEYSWFKRNNLLSSK